MALIEVQTMKNKIEELGKVMIEIDGYQMRIAELEKIKEGLKFAINIEQSEMQKMQQEQIANTKTKITDEVPHVEVNLPTGKEDPHVEVNI